MRIGRVISFHNISNGATKVGKFIKRAGVASAIALTPMTHAVAEHVNTKEINVVEEKASIAANKLERTFLSAFKKADKNKDLKISGDEFVHSGGNIEDFSYFDQNGDGKLNIDEYENLEMFRNNSERSEELKAKENAEQLNVAGYLLGGVGFLGIFAGVVRKFIQHDVGNYHIL